MSDPLKSFDAPDQVLEAPGVREEIVEIGGLSVGRVTHAPGWRWSTHIKPVVGTDRCQSRHVGVVVSGRFGIELADGATFEADAGAVYDVPPGHDGWTVGDEPLVVIEWTGLREWLLPPAGQRVLATLLFTDVVESTMHARRLGDRSWRALLGAHDEAIRGILAERRGREVSTTGDGFLAVFDGPARAIGAAVAIRDRIRSLGLELRQAVHVGEIELVGSDVRGVTVHEAARIMAAAGPGEILVSSTTRALTGASGWDFRSIGTRELKGLPGAFELFAVAGPGT